MKRILLALTAFATIATASDAKETKSFSEPISLKAVAKTQFVAPLKGENNNLLDANAVTKLPNVVYTPIDNIISIYNLTNRDLCSKPFFYDYANNLYTYVLSTPSEENVSDLILRTSNDFTNWSPKVLAWDPTALFEDGYIPMFYPSVMTMKVGDSVFAFTAGKYSYTKEGLGGYALLMQSMVNLTEMSAPFPFATTTYTNNDGDKFDWYSENYYMNGGVADEGATAVCMKLTAGIHQELAGDKMSGIYFENFLKSLEEDPQVMQGTAVPSSAFEEGENSLQSSLIGTAQTGNRIYVGYLGLQLNGPNFYAPGFAYTDDFGMTWSEPVFAPKSIFQAFAKSKGYKTQDSFSLSYFPANKNLLAHQNGTMSMFTMITELNSSKNFYTIKNYLVEVYFDGASWSIREIADNVRPFSIQSHNFTDGSNYPEFDPTWGQIEAAKTGDEKYYIVKWRDGSVRTGKTSSGMDVYLPQTTLKVAARYQNSTKWATFQIADTTKMPSYNYLPSVVPNDLVNIPMLGIQPEFKGTEITRDDSLFTATNIYNHGFNDEGDSVILAAKGVVSTTKFTIPINQLGVENENNITIQNIAVNSISPNPSTGENAYLNINLSSAAYVKIEIFDMMGKSVSAPIEGMRSEGEQAILLNNLNLANGTYNVVVTSNSFRASKIMTIVR